MTFEVVQRRGEPVIIASGEIGAGDSDRLNATLSKARRSSGYYLLVLSSPGGSVKEAFALSRVMDGHYVITYVPSGSVCVSACAAIVFIAGREHVVDPDGKLGFHGCFDARTKKTVGFCNELIAQHAVAHGTAYGSIMAFIRDVPSSEIYWFNGEGVDCWAISRYEITSPPPNYERCVFDAIRGVRDGKN